MKPVPTQRALLAGEQDAVPSPAERGGVRVGVKAPRSEKGLVSACSADPHPHPPPSAKSTDRGESFPALLEGVGACRGARNFK